MSKFQDLSRAVLIAISTLSSDDYRDVDGAELIAELSRNGHDPDPVSLYNLLFRLRDDGGLITFNAEGDGVKDWNLIRLSEAGRQKVEGWPSSPAPRPPM